MKLTRSLSAFYLNVQILLVMSEDLLTKVKKKIQKFKQHKNGAPKQATLHLKFQMVAVRR